MLPTRPLGTTGVPVTILGFGGAPLGDLFERLDEGTAVATVAAAHRAGMTLFDTSPHYGNGLSELRFGAALRRFPRDSYVLSTKVGRRMNPRMPGGSVGGPGFAGGVPHASVVDYSYDGTLRSFEQSLLRLGLDRIDILLLHDVDVWTHGPEMADQRFREAMEGAYRAVHELRGEGVIKAVGLGLNEADTAVRFLHAGDFDCVLLAGRYSLLHQDALDEFLPLAEQKGISVILGGVFNSGILATGAQPGAHFNYRPAPPEILDKAPPSQRPDMLSALVTPPHADSTRTEIGPRVQKLTRSSPWKLVGSMPVGFLTHHPQGMVKIGGALFVSSVEIRTPTKRHPQPLDGYDRDTGEGVGHLFKIDSKGNLIADLVLGEGSMYHPGGVDYDGRHIWVSVAEYRPNSRSIVYRVDPETMTAMEVFRFPDHIGGILHNTDDRTLHGVS